jgi:hypothetical protein
MLTMAVTLSGVSAGAFGQADQGVALQGDASTSDPFDAGSWNFSLMSFGFTEFDGNEQLYGGGATVGFYFIDGLAINGEFLGYAIAQETVDDAPGGGFNLMLRWHSWRNGDVSVYLECGAGLVQATRRVPAGGTHFNFVPQAGVGFTVRLRDNVHFYAGARYLHLSNAGTGDRPNSNPGIDTIGGYAGVIFAF